MKKLLTILIISLFCCQASKAMESTTQSKTIFPIQTDNPNIECHCKYLYQTDIRRIITGKKFNKYNMLNNTEKQQFEELLEKMLENIDIYKLKIKNKTETGIKIDSFNSINSRKYLTNNLEVLNYQKRKQMYFIGSLISGTLITAICPVEIVLALIYMDPTIKIALLSLFGSGLFGLSFLTFLFSRISKDYDEKIKKMEPNLAKIIGSSLAKIISSSPKYETIEPGEEKTNFLFIKKSKTEIKNEKFYEELCNRRVSLRYETSFNPGTSTIEAVQPTTIVTNYSAYPTYTYEDNLSNAFERLQLPFYEPEQVQPNAIQ